MKGVLLPVAGLGVGGAALFGTMDAPDFERTVNRSPTAVYAAFESALPIEPIDAPGEDGMPAVALRTAKVEGRMIRYELTFDNLPAVTAELNFEPAEGGSATLMTAELDIDDEVIGSAFETEAGMNLARVPESLVDRGFAELMNGIVDEVEAGRPLGPIGADRLGVRRRGDSADLADRRYEAQRSQHEAARPMSRPTPMVDPNAAARAYREGRSNPDG